MDINDTFRGIDQNIKDLEKKEVTTQDSQVDFLKTFQEENNFESILCKPNKKSESPEMSSEESNKELLDIIN
jgi:hypothetical protein